MTRAAQVHETLQCKSRLSLLTGAGRSGFAGLASGSLRANAYRYVFPSAVLASKSNVADEVVASNASPLEQQCERIIRNSPAAAGQPEAGISL